MGILLRFSEIISANVNSLLDRAEDPSKMVDQYLRRMLSDLAEVKKETAAVMVEETRSKRAVVENQREMAKYTELAKKALLAGNEGDARTFLFKKQSLEATGADMEMTYAIAHENAVKMRQMHDKLVSDINGLKERRKAISAKSAVAKTTEIMNGLSTSNGKSEDPMSGFTRMEEKVSRRLDVANAMAELNAEPLDEAQSLELKYHDSVIDNSVNNELAELKEQLGIE